MESFFALEILALTGDADNVSSVKWQRAAFAIKTLDQGKLILDVSNPSIDAIVCFKRTWQKVKT